MLIVLTVTASSAPGDSPDPFPPAGADSAEEDVVVEDSRIRPGLFHLGLSEAWLEFSTIYEDRRVEPQRGRRPAQTNRDLRFEESLHLRLNGDVIDPLLFSWDAGFDLGLSQERYDERGGRQSNSESRDGLLLQYDVSFSLLREKPLSVSGYARQSRNRIPRRFLPSLTDERNEGGITAVLNLNRWVTTFGLEWSDIDREGNRADRDNESSDLTRFYVDSSLDLGDDHALRFSYEHQDEDISFQGTRESLRTRRDHWRLGHDFVFGDEDEHSLNTVVRISEESGPLARDETELTSRLSLTHSDSFKTAFRYSYYQLGQGSLDLTRNKVDLQAIFRPDEFFQLTGQAFWLSEDSVDNLDSRQFGAGVDLRYRRPNPWGEFTANVSFNADRERLTGRAEAGIIRGEAHALDSLQPRYLIKPDIERFSIVAYNLDRTRIYLRGEDFNVISVGRRTAVVRTLNGRIGPSETVLFNYRYAVPNDADIATYRFDVLLEQQCHNGLTPYYGFELRRQDADGTYLQPVFEDQTERHRFGVRMDRPDWSATGEVELFDDSILPYHRYHLDGRVLLWDDAVHSMELTAGASWFNFRGDFDARRVWLVDVGAREEIRINQYLSTNIGVLYRWENDSRDGETNAVDLEYGLRFRRGQLDVSLTVEYDLLTVDTRDQGFGVWLTVRRDIDDWLSPLFADAGTGRVR